MEHVLRIRYPRKSPAWRIHGRDLCDSQSTPILRARCGSEWCVLLRLMVQPDLLISCAAMTCMNLIALAGADRSADTVVPTIPVYARLLGWAQSQRFANLGMLRNGVRCDEMHMRQASQRASPTRWARVAICESRVVQASWSAHDKNVACPPSMPIALPVVREIVQARPLSSAPCRV